MAIARNILIHGASSAFAAVTIFALHAIVARYLGVEHYGYFSFGLAFAALFIAAFDPGIHLLVIREVARRKERAAKYLVHNLAYKALALPVATLIAGTALYWLTDSRIGLLVSGIMFFSMWLNLSYSSALPMFTAFERFDLNAVSVLVERSVLLAIVVAVCLLDFGVYGVAWAHVAARAIAFVFALWLIHRWLVQIRADFEWPFLRRMVAAAIPIGGFYATTYLYNYLDTIMLGAMRTPEEVGLYSAAYRLYEGPMIVSSVINQVLMPRLSNAYAEKSPKLTTLGLSGLALVLGSGLALTVFWLLFADFVIALIFGAEFAGTAEALRILAIGSAIVFIVSFLQTMLISFDRQKQVLYIALFGLCFNAILNLAVIPKHGFVGAAWTTVVSAFVVAVALLIASHRAYSAVSARPASTPS